MARPTSRLLVPAACFAAGALVVGAAWATTAVLTGPAQAPVTQRADAPAPRISTASPTPSHTATALPEGCADSSVTVSTAAQLQSALNKAAPGQTIALRDGTYSGNFEVSKSGTVGSPISLCGSSKAILDGGNPEHGYVLHLDNVSYWRLSGFTVQNGQKGVMADNTQKSVIEGLTVSHIGDEGIHLRDNSSDNTVDGNTISDTGLRKPKFGEGIYVGSSKNNWCDISNCDADRSDRNVLSNNVISQTPAESIDIKEGTTGGTVTGNRLDGTGMTDADSWVDVKGNDWTITGNSGVNSPQDGFQTHELLQGWGTNNVFSKNDVSLGNDSGLGFAFRPALHNVVNCDNRMQGTNELSNVRCTA